MSDLLNHASRAPLRRRDWALLSLYCLLLFGIAVVGGRPLTMHEAVLPQSAREMLADHDWIVPHKGGEPWLESPPLPQWCTVAIASLFGRCDTEAIVRIGPALVGLGVVLLTVWMALFLMPPRMALLAGYIQATTFQFTRYAWLAEDEIYLCGVITLAWACFVRLEFGPVVAADRPQSWLVLVAGPRSRWMLLFWIALGSTNLVKGVLFGTVVAASAMAAWLFCPGHWSRVGKYVWVWGLLIWGAILAAWPLAAYSRFPNVTEVWWYDLGGRMSGQYRDINQPLWYYPVNLLWMVCPWLIVIPFGMRGTARAAWTQPLSAERWLWIWALAVPAVLTLPSGKHHHYLLHGMVPWAMLAAHGVAPLRRAMQSLPGLMRQPTFALVTIGLPAIVALGFMGHHVPGGWPVAGSLMIVVPATAMLLTWGLWHPQMRIAAATAFGVLLVGYSAGHILAGQLVDTHRQDVALLKHARAAGLHTGETVVVDLDRQPLTGFLDLFYQQDSSRAIHNISFLNAPEWAGRSCLLISRAVEFEALTEIGSVEVVAASERRLRDHRGDARLTLFRVTPGKSTRSHVTAAAYHTTTPAAVTVTPMQAMHRAEGPVWR